MKGRLHSLLCRMPGLYARLELLRRAPNLEKALYLRLLRAGDTVVDAGANTGYYTLLFSHVVGHRGRVHAFEPVPPTFDLLRQRLEGGRRSDNVTLNRCALADAPGERRLYVPGSDLGQASLARHTEGSWRAAGEVQSHVCPVTTLDLYFGEAGGPGPSFLKCDVEGAEVFVLRGARETLRRTAPLVLLEVCADWTRNLGYGPGELVELLRSLGYDGFYLLTDRLHQLGDEAARELEALRGSANVLCVPAGDRQHRLRAALAPLRRYTAAGDPR